MRHPARSHIRADTKSLYRAEVHGSSHILISRFRISKRIRPIELRLAELQSPSVGAKNAILERARTCSKGGKQHTPPLRKLEGNENSHTGEEEGGWKR